MRQDSTATEDQEQSGAKRETDPLRSPTIESTVVESEIVSTRDGEEETEQGSEERPVPPPHKRVFIPNWSNIIACILFLILVGEHVVPLAWTALDSSLHPKATVTIFAAKRHLQHTYLFLAVTGKADPGEQQIASRFVSFTTATKTETIQTTGIGFTPAVQAKGEITFYNEAPYSQTIAAGTVLTSSDGVQVITDESASIPAGNGVTNGSASVIAHAIVGGTVGNIQPFDVNTLCCLSGILARNTAAFTGGVDPKSYPTISTTDLQTAAHQLAGILAPLAKTGVQRQIAQTERVLTSLHCRLTPSSTPKVGERATTARVSVSETCQTQVYDDAALQEQTRLLFDADASKALPWGILQGNSLALTLATPLLLDSSHHTYKLAITASGTLVFHLSETQLHSLVTQIAGKPITQAQRELLQLQGVQGVSIQPAQQGENSLPQDPTSIRIILS
jgi:hypothetical protein